MLRYFYCIIFLLTTFYSVANKDSLIVYSLLEQAKKTNTKDSLETFANKAMDYSVENNYLDGVLSVAKFFAPSFPKI